MAMVSLYVALCLASIYHARRRLKEHKQIHAYIIETPPMAGFLGALRHFVIPSITEQNIMSTAISSFFNLSTGYF